ncbi:MAG: agmatinase [Thermoplasmata archaeon]|nr:agmatinase [Thermoplasmata archaeon]
MGGTLFSDATAALKDSKYVIFGAPLDITGTHRRGTKKGPESIRHESYTFEPFVPDLDIDLEEVDIYDMGDLPMKNPRKEISEAVREIIGAEKVPIMMGGEHSVSPYAVEAFSDVSVLVFDAHLDYREELHGDPNNHACATMRMRHVLKGKPILPVGIRSICKSEFIQAKHDGLNYITADKVRELGTKRLIDLIEDLLPGKLYISVDIDGIDPSFAPGVGTPEPYGIDPIVVRDVIRHFAGRAVGFDMVEVCPPADNGNTAALAARLIKDFIAAREKELMK